MPLWISIVWELADLGTKILGSEQYNLMLPNCFGQISVEGSVQEG
jgi:hypothetical protein